MRTYARMYVRSVSHVTIKRKEVDHILWVWGSVSRALRARGSPATIPISANYNAFWQICLVIIFGSLYFYQLRYFDLGRASRIVHQSSVQWMISTSRVVTPRATWHLRPSHGVSTPIWLSLNCYCFAPHHKSLSLLSLLSFSTLFFPKITSRCTCRMLLYMRKLA